MAIASASYVCNNLIPNYSLPFEGMRSVVFFSAIYVPFCQISTLYCEPYLLAFLALELSLPLLQYFVCSIHFVSTDANKTRMRNANGCCDLSVSRGLGCIYGVYIFLSIKYLPQCDINIISALSATVLVTYNDLSGLPNTFVFCCVNSFIYFLASF